MQIEQLDNYQNINSVKEITPSLNIGSIYNDSNPIIEIIIDYQYEEGKNIEVINSEFIGSLKSIMEVNGETKGTNNTIYFSSKGKHTIKYFIDSNLESFSFRNLFYGSEEINEVKFVNFNRIKRTNMDEMFFRC